MLLDEENDQFLKYDEIDQILPFILNLDKKDRGIIESEEDFRNAFESLGKFQLDRKTFNEFVDKANFNAGLVRDKLYNKKAYSGCCAKIFCSCCKCCNRIIRKKMLQAIIKKEDELLRLYVYNEEPKTTKMQDMLAVILAIV